MVDEGMGVRAISRETGINQGTISRRVAKLKRGAAREIVVHNAGAVVTQQIDGINQLARINQKANEMLDSLMLVINGEPEALAKVPEAWRNKDPRELVLKTMAEIRAQIAGQFDLLQDLFDWSQVAQFQQEVLDSIKEAAPDVRDKIIENLNRKNTLLRPVTEPPEGPKAN
jgi:hypothetical protein